MGGLDDLARYCALIFQSPGLIEINNGKQLFCIGHTADLLLGLHLGGLGQHSYTLNYSTALHGLAILYANLILYTLSIFFAKMSIIFFIKRLAGATCKPLIRRTINGFFVFHTAFAVAMLGVLMFQCNPARAGWDLNLRFLKTTRCRNYGFVHYFMSAVHVGSDCALLGLPVGLVWGLQMHRRKKIAVIGIFVLGFLYVGRTARGRNSPTRGRGRRCW